MISCGWGSYIYPTPSPKVRGTWLKKWAEEYKRWKIWRSDVASRHDMAVTKMNSAAVVTNTRPAQKQ